MVLAAALLLFVVVNDGNSLGVNTGTDNGNRNSIIGDEGFVF